MCGIAGVLMSKPLDNLEGIIDEMTKTLALRGPDGQHTWLDSEQGIALGHRRLAILDLSPAGVQPKISQNQRFVITYNGEIYNYKALKSQLEAEGITFHSHSDTEVLLEAISAWGIEDTLKKLNGIFAFALWDRSQKTLILARDHLGIKPLYWYNHGGNFAFASELKALHKLPFFKPTINRNALCSYFRFSYIPEPLSIFEHTHKLEAGHFLILKWGEKPLLKSYWNLKDTIFKAKAKPFQGTDQEAIAALDGVLKKAVDLQMVSDVPLGAFLSGGVDSSTVVALMQSQSVKKIKTFSIGFEDPAYNEAPHAKLVADHLGTDHTELYANSKSVQDIIPLIADFCDEPFADSSQIPTYLVSQLARQHVTVSLSGDGGDELFAGYNRYYIWSKSITKKLLGLPKPLRKIVSLMLSSVPQLMWDTVLSTLLMGRGPKHLGNKLHKLAKALSVESEWSFYISLLSHSLNPEELVLGSTEPKNIIWDPKLTHDFPEFIERMQYADMKTYLIDDILFKVDRASMANSLEARVPLLDPDVIAFSWQLPMHYKIRNNTPKWLLKQVLYQYVPKNLIDRPKQGFGIPLGDWLKTSLKAWASELLSTASLEQHGLLNVALIQQKWREHVEGVENHQYELWNVLMFQAWYLRWCFRR